MLYIKNAKILTGTGDVVEGNFTVKDGKFEAIGSSVIIPEGAQCIDVSGKIITPGLIDVHTHLGVYEEGIGQEGHDFNETSSESTPQVRAIDGINPQEKGFEDARSFGVTTVQVMPGSANVIGGEMLVVKTVGNVVDEMIVKNPSGLKAATGENPKRFYGSKGKMPTTRMGLAARLREKLIEAQNYMNKRQKNECDRDLGLEHIAKVLNKEIPLRVHAHRADDIATVLRIQREFNIRLTIEHCTEGHQIADFIAKHDVRVSVGPTMSTRSKIELADKGWHTIVALANEGIPVSITTDHPVVGIEHLMTSAILAVKNGLTEEQALEAITLNAAKHIGVEDRVGSIEVGKDADFVVWNGDPFDLRSTVEATYIDGNKVYQK
ncbi:amidohydrolase [Sporosarcina pasteurii]|uniref:Imidazolonepropionase n=1 Tax=Sporosarcina pasteurii TaxID=1474 RepID=A0A380CLI8_SPOPA|nr:amidohydrolase [Sporosarcina pasteurii]MDS9471922.1 amidohydrolase [Sporosarcina pasteurii]QBQ06654.1 amidohydrolase [Sporosarcina pasteurii]SUJ21941.1 Imidazolonepropionase [Sporosarcina pasteurii]